MQSGARRARLALRSPRASPTATPWNSRDSTYMTPPPRKHDGDPERERGQRGGPCRSCRSAPDSRSRVLRCRDACSLLVSRPPEHRILRPRSDGNNCNSRDSDDGASRDRTGDLLLAKRSAWRSKNPRNPWHLRTLRVLKRPWGMPVFAVLYRRFRPRGLNSSWSSSRSCARSRRGRRSRTRRRSASRPRRPSGSPGDRAFLDLSHRDPPRQLAKCA